MTHPTFTHDCDCCTFLGSVVQDEQWHDLYTCRGSAIIRYGDNGPEYYSAPIDMAKRMGGLYHVIALLYQ